MGVESLLDKRLVLVTGKGGTGKTTFAAAIAVLAAARGRRTLLLEIDAQRPSLAPVFGFKPQFQARAVAGQPKLEVANLTWPEALESYLGSMIPVSRLVKLVLSNAIVSRFIDFTPGSQELIELSVIANAAERYDLVVVDMPATGHAFSMLDIVRSAVSLFRSGPVRGRAEQLRDLMAAPSTHLALVALPEEMVVNETLETIERFRKGGLLSGPPTVFLNRASAPSGNAAERELLARLAASPLTPDQAEWVAAGLWEARLEVATARALERLEEGGASKLAGPAVLVPPVGGVSGPREVVAQVANNIGRTLGLTARELSWS
jgi:anion-transporting  ArsA/GET3 family ATPase